MAEDGILVDVRVHDGRHHLKLATTAACVGVCGPSGAGKSTLLRVLAGVEPGVTGTVRALGETWLGPALVVPAWRRGVGWVPQDALLFPHLNVRQNLDYSRRSGAEECLGIARLLGVSALLDRAPRNLSGGERQRVALGRALLARPRLLLLDEPFSALDRNLRARLAADVAAYCKDRALPVVLASHDDPDLTAFNAERWEFVDGVLSRG